jgi:hypothetical protein
MNVNQKGVIGLVKVMADLVANQYDIFTPTSGACPIDLIVANASMELRRMQVKYREADKQNALFVSLDSVVNGRRVPVDVSRVDCWGIYCPQTNEVYYVLREEIPKRSIRLCLGDFKGRRGLLAQNFMDPRVFGELTDKASGPVANRIGPLRVWGSRPQLSAGCECCSEFQSTDAAVQPGFVA